MIFETPIQTKGLFELVEDSDNPRDWPIKKNYPQFDCIFILFHPFLQIKNGHENSIDFKTGDWPDKRKMIEHCDIVNWSTIIGNFNFPDIQTLDRALGCYHSATLYGDKIGNSLLKNVLKRKDLMPPQVDEFPEILENKTLGYLKNKGYSKMYCYTDIDEKSNLIDVETLILGEGLPCHVRLESEKGDLLIVQDFDQRFSYLMGDMGFVTDMIKQLDFEGFFCDDLTLEAWSLAPEKDKKMKLNEF